MNYLTKNVHGIQGETMVIWNTNKFLVILSTALVLTTSYLVKDWKRRSGWKNYFSNLCNNDLNCSAKNLTFYGIGIMVKIVINMFFLFSTYLIYLCTILILFLNYSEKKMMKSTHGKIFNNKKFKIFNNFLITW